eukprot:544127_1
MAMSGLGFNINTKPSDPDTFNTWLRNDEGYCCINNNCNNLVLWKPDNLTSNHLQVTNPTDFTYPSMYDIRRGLDAMDTIFLAHNPSLFHFVLATNASWSSDEFSVIDPNFNTTMYTFNETGGEFIVYNIYAMARPYQYYAQCDIQWKNDKMGKNGETICAVGCLMSSVAMAMESYNIYVENSGKNVTTTPETLNIWLQNNNGYSGDTSNLDESALNKIPQNRVIWPSDGMHTTNDIKAEVIREYVQDHKRRVVIANVMQGKHFVLVTDIEKDMDTLKVNDPGQFHDTYSYKNDVVGWRLFDLS